MSVTGFLINATRQGRVWSGGDGKYELVDGAWRPKWNSYSMEGNTFVCTVNQFQLFWRRDTPPGNTGIDPYTPSVSFRPTFTDLRVTPDMEMNALTKLLTKVKEHDFNLAVELGQLNQTVNLLSDNLRKLGRAALALKRGDFSTAARQLGARPRGTRLKKSDISGRWLELQYGWLPLVGSSFEAAKAFEAISNGPRKTLIRATVKRNVTWNASASPTHFKATCGGSVRRTILYELKEEMSAERQLGLENPASVLWELTPWSFVVDWFIPIGTYIDNLHQIPSLKGRFLVTDVLRFEMQEARFEWIKPDYWPGYTAHAVAVPKVRFSHTVLRRQSMASPPKVPPPQFRLNGINSSKRLWNAIALASQRFRG